MPTTGRGAAPSRRRCGFRLYNKFERRQLTGGGVNENTQVAEAIRPLGTKRPAVKAQCSAQLAPVQGASVSRVTLTAAAVERIGLRTANVQQLPALTWNSVRGAAVYEYEVSADSRFNSITLGRGLGKGVSHTYNLAAALDKTVADGTYYWRVRGLTAKDRTGPWSRVWRVVKRWNIEPLITGGDGAEVSWPRTPLEFAPT